MIVAVFVGVRGDGEELCRLTALNRLAAAT